LLDLLKFGNKLLYFKSYLVENPEARKKLGRPRRKWEDNIKIDFHDVG
jgi:hypothetical protein